MTGPVDRRLNLLEALFPPSAQRQQAAADDAAIKAFLDGLSMDALLWLNGEGRRLDRAVVDRELEPDQLDAAFTAAAHEAKRLQDAGELPPRYELPSGRVPERPVAYSAPPADPAPAPEPEQPRAPAHEANPGRFGLRPVDPPTMTAPIGLPPTTPRVVDLHTGSGQPRAGVPRGRRR